MIEYYKSGLLKEETNYQRGLKNGESKLYHENGIVKKMLSYRMGTLYP
jgi:antitoxin component YwqK of YwqJK toxin-antitoxin module